MRSILLLVLANIVIYVTRYNIAIIHSLENDEFVVSKGTISMMPTGSYSLLSLATLRYVRQDNFEYSTTRCGGIR